MKHFMVKDLMVPISEYATVQVGTSLIDVVKALEEAQEAFTTSKYQHRAVLVLDENGRVVGKISQLRALKAIEPNYEFNTDIEQLKDFNFSENYIGRVRDLYRTKLVISKSVLRQASQKRVEEFMQTPTPGEYVSENCSLDTAIHRLVSGPHLSLLVTHQEKIVGILRMSDVFAAVFHEMMALDN